MEEYFDDAHVHSNVYNGTIFYDVFVYFLFGSLFAEGTSHVDHEHDVNDDAAIAADDGDKHHSSTMGEKVGVTADTARDMEKSPVDQPTNVEVCVDKNSSEQIAADTNEADDKADKNSFKQTENNSSLMGDGEDNNHSHNTIQASETTTSTRRNKVLLRNSLPQSQPPPPQNHHSANKRKAEKFTFFTCFLGTSTIVNKSLAFFILLRPNWNVPTVSLRDHFLHKFSVLRLRAFLDEEHVSSNGHLMKSVFQVERRTDNSMYC